MKQKLAEHPPVDPNWVYMEDEIEKVVEDVIFNGAPPAQTLYDAEKRIEKLRNQ